MLTPEVVELGEGDGRRQVLDGGDAVERRSIFVQVDGLRQVGSAPDPRSRNARRPTSANSGAAGRVLRTNR